MTAPESAEPLDDPKGQPRNRVAFALGRQRRELIRCLMLERAQQFPLARPLTGEQLRDALRRRGVYLAVTTIRWHVEQIRLEADREACTGTPE